MESKRDDGHRHGGVLAYWKGEAQQYKASKPTFGERTTQLDKLTAICPVTEELLMDEPAIESTLDTKVAQEFAWKADAAIFGGSGSGSMPLGMVMPTTNTALVTVDKETSQGAGTFTGANAIKMQARAMPRHRDRLAWLMHPDVEEQLPYLAIQSGEAAKFLWNPEGGLGNFDTQRVLNKPVLFEDSCSALGSKGDILLVDPYQYILLTKGTAKQDWSIHVEFLTDQNCFRMVFRCNGAPKVSKPLTIKNSTKTRSPFVALADRK